MSGEEDNKSERIMSDEELDNLFADIEESNDNYDSTELVESIEEVIEGSAEPEMEFDQETEDFLNELSDFLDEEDEQVDYLANLDDDDDLPSLDDFEDEEIPTLSELVDNYTEDEVDQNTYEVDDEETSQLRGEAATVALGLMNYVEYNVVTLENELSILGDAFNQLLDKTHELDEKISRLSDKVNKAKLDGTKQAMEFIHSEIKLISDNLEGAIKSTDPDDREVLQENVDILRENKNIIEQQIIGLKEIGSNTAKLEKDLEVLEVSIAKLQNAMNTNQVFSVSNLISNEINQVIVQSKDARRAEDAQDIALLQENFDLLMENKSDIEEKLWDLDDKGIDIRGLGDQLEILNINLEQFSRAIDESIHQISITSRTSKPNFNRR